MTMTLEESRAWRPEHPGWSIDILPFYEMLAQRIPKGGSFAEVGVFLGRSIRFMAERRPDLKIFAIDPWADGESQGYTGPCEHAEYIAKHGSLFRAFLASMPGDVLDRLHILRATADDLELVGVQLDALFLDGAHDFASVRKDILVFGPCVRSGGIIAGHDYNHNFDPSTVGKDDGRLGVIAAVDQLADSLESGAKPHLMGTCWWVDVP